MFVWAKIPSKNSIAYADKLLTDHAVFITPGDIFGKNGKGYLRMSLCCNENLSETGAMLRRATIAERIRERFAKRETDAGPRAEAGRNATDSTRRARGCAIRCVTLTFFIHFVRRLREKGYRVS